MTTQLVFDKAEYRYQDASVPPMYHRSYTIEATAQTLKTDVDVYNTPLAQDARAMQESDWKHLLELAGKMEKPTTKIAKGATGTKTFIVRLHHQNKVAYELIWDSMNDVTPETHAFVQFLQGLVTNLAEMKAKPYKPE